MYIVTTGSTTIELTLNAETELLQLIIALQLISDLLANPPLPAERHGRPLALLTRLSNIKRDYDKQQIIRREQREQNGM